MKRKLRIFRKKFPARRIMRILLITAVSMLALVIGAYFLFPFREGHLREMAANGALQVCDADGGIVGWRVGRDDNWRLPVPLSAVNRHMINATIAAEDKRFYEHHGVDFLALARALRQNLTHARRISGASTLTMQTIRLLYPRPRTYFSKMREALAALQLEKIASKELILENYCNLAPYGGNVIGIQAAAMRYFGKNAAELTLGEAALLAGIPQSPARFNPRKKLSAALKRREFVLERMRALGYISAAEAARARGEKIVLVNPQDSAGRISGLTDWVAALHPEGGVWRTTIVPSIQKTVHNAASAHAARLRALGIDGVAVAVIDVEKSALVAFFANPAPENPQFGKINGALIRRPAGSLLKPFIYAAAYQRGVAVPASIVEDEPRIWDGYRPENMDRKFLGKITAADALQKSRNIPAVAMLEAAGRENVAEILRGLGLPLPDTGHLGLSLALGTPELCLRDLTNAYAALARGGVFRELRLTAPAARRETAPENPAGRALTPAAAWLALQSLSDNENPSAVWKTGTSWKHRDAWAIAVTPRHAVGVWTGNWSGAGNERLAGAETALPLAQKILAALDGGHFFWPRPAGITETELCAVSGKIPGIFCANRQKALTISGISPTRICSQCRPAEKIPAIAEESAAPAPRLLSPQPHAEYFLAPDAPRTLAWQAESSGGDIVWLLDGRETARTVSGEIFAWPMIPGAHRLTAVDSAGRTTGAQFTVRQTVP